MKRLVVYHRGKSWFGHLVETRRTESGEVKELRRVVIPQTEAGIEAFARQRGFEIEWDDERGSPGGDCV